MVAAGERGRAVPGGGGGAGPFPGAGAVALGPTAAPRTQALLRDGAGLNAGSRSPARLTPGSRGRCPGRSTGGVVAVLRRDRAVGPRSARQRQPGLSCLPGWGRERGETPRTRLRARGAVAAVPLRSWRVSAGAAGARVVQRQAEGSGYSPSGEKRWAGIRSQCFVPCGSEPEALSSPSFVR